MNILKRLLQNIARKSRTFRGAYTFSFGSPNWSKRDYRTFSQEGYAGNPYVYSAINALKDAVVQPPPILYRVKEKGQIEQAMEREYDYVKALQGVSSRKWSKEACARQIIRKGMSRIIKTTGIHPTLARRIAIKQMVFTGELEDIDSHPALDLLARPNGYYQTSYNEFVAAFVLNLMISGEVFTEPVGSRGPAGIPNDLYILPSDRFVSERPQEGNPLPAFRYSGGIREKFVYSPDASETEVFFSKLYDPTNPLRGLSPMEAAIRSVDLNNEGRKYNLSYMQNGGVPAGLVTGEFDEVQAGAIREGYGEEMAGSDNAGRLLTVGGKNLKYHQLGLDASKLLWGDTITLTAREISMIFNVAPEIIGDSASRTYSNYEEARLALYQDAALPLADFMYGHWNQTWLKRFDDNLLLDYDSDQIDAIQDDVDKAYMRLDNAKFLTINEKREAVGFEPIDGGDVILVSIAEVPLEASLMADEEEREEAVEEVKRIKLLELPKKEVA